MVNRYGFRTGLIISGMLVGAALIIYAQEAAPPSVDLYQEQPEATITPSPPPNGPELPELKQLDETFKPPSLGTDAEGIKMRVEWRELRNRTVNDPDVQAAKAFAQAARTDLEKRNRLREYYNVYYKRMSALTTNTEIKLALEAFKTGHQGMLAQPKVRPSPIPEGATPTATAVPPRKKNPNKHKKNQLKG
jgi:hypothetical protein